MFTVQHNSKVANHSIKQDQIFIKVYSKRLIAMKMEKTIKTEGQRKVQTKKGHIRLENATPAKVYGSNPLSYQY